MPLTSRSYRGVHLLTIPISLKLANGMNCVITFLLSHTKDDKFKLYHCHMRLATLKHHVPMLSVFYGVRHCWFSPTPTQNMNIYSSPYLYSNDPCTTTGCSLPLFVLCKKYMMYRVHRGPNKNVFNYVNSEGKW